jgi:ornithine cyclodeaminase/alanine dehydrogenase-like protein (mu-crystallin family)
MRTADVITCATMSPEPLVRGSLLKQGTHVNVVGAFRPDMRETDDETVRRARILSIPMRARWQKPATSCSLWHVG